MLIMKTFHLSILLFLTIKVLLKVNMYLCIVKKRDFFLL
jgi:hypothetical protein